MILTFPYLLFSVIAYNVIVFGTGTPFETIVFQLPMISGALWNFTLGDLLIVGTLVLLFIEILKATRTGGNSLIDHALSTIVFIICLIEFLVVPEASTSLFFFITRDRVDRRGRRFFDHDPGSTTRLRRRTAALLERQHHTEIFRFACAGDRRVRRARIQVMGRGPARRVGSKSGFHTVLRMRAARCGIWTGDPTHRRSTAFSRRSVINRFCVCPCRHIAV